jgi:hypothetical protein
MLTKHVPKNKLLPVKIYPMSRFIHRPTRSIYEIAGLVFLFYMRCVKHLPPQPSTLDLHAFLHSALFPGVKSREKSQQEALLSGA